MAKVTLIRPPSVVGRFALTLNATPPLSLAYVGASLAAAGHDVTIVDGVGEALDSVRPGYADGILYQGLSVAAMVARVPRESVLIGISCLFSHEWPLVRELVAALAAALPGVPVVLGGEHATALPEFSLQEAPGLTCCVLGEGEATAVDLVAAVQADGDLGRVPGLAIRSRDGIVRTADRPRIRALDRIPLPRWDLVPIDRYLDRGLSFGVSRGRTLPILATRGCPYRCTFCSSPAMWTTRYEARDPLAVVQEIEGCIARWRIDAVDFYDLTAIVKRDWVLEFCRLLRERDVRITWQLPSGTRSEALDGEVLAAMRASGCRNVSYAPESGSRRTLARIRKQVSLPRMAESMRTAVDLGLNVKANIMIGFPDERRAAVLETLAFIARMALDGVHDVSVWTFSPYPGSQLFAELRAAGRIPALDDGYFASLLSYSDLLGAVSFDEHVSARELERYRLAGMALFYALSYATHPTRPVQTLANLVQMRYESRLEMSLGNLVRRLRAAAG